MLRAIFLAFVFLMLGATLALTALANPPELQNTLNDMRAPMLPSTRVLRIVSFDPVRARDDMQFAVGTSGRNITRLYGTLLNPAAFGPTGTVKCVPSFNTVNTIIPGSLVSNGVRLVDVFFGGEINAENTVSISVAEANELVAFLNAGGIVYASADRDNWGWEWNPLFIALGINDRFANISVTSGAISYPLTSRITNGAFGRVGYMNWTPFAAIQTSTLTTIVAAGGIPAMNTLVAEGAFGAGYLIAHGDALAHDSLTSDPDDLRYFLNLFGAGCQPPKLMIYQNAMPRAVWSGLRVTFTLNVANIGGSAVNGVFITDTVPSQVGNLAYTSSGISLIPAVRQPDAGGTLVWSAGTMPANSAGIITLTGIIEANTQAGLTLTNTALIAGTDGVTPSMDSSAASIVTQDCYATANNGASVYRDLQSAIDVAPDNGTVKVAGYCANTQMRNSTSQLAYIAKSLTLRGGFLPTSWSASDPANPAILDAAHNGRVVYIAGAYTVTLQDLIVTNGMLYAPGGGIYAPVASTLSLSQTAVLQNSAPTSSGGGLATYGNLILVRSRFAGNSATGAGGAVYVAGTATISACQFVGNTGGEGGGVYAATTLTVTNSRFSNNSATDNGGGLSMPMSTGNGRLVNNLFLANRAGKQGAALQMLTYGGNATVVDVIHNTITSPTIGSGSAINIPNGIAHITNTIITSYSVGIQNGFAISITQDYNLFYATLPTSKTVTGGSHSLTNTNPLFVNLSTGIANLAPGSPAIDAAQNALISDDLNGNPRPSGAAPDIGAFEGVWINHLIYLPIVIRPM